MHLLIGKRLTVLMFALVMIFGMEVCPDLEDFKSVPVIEGWNHQGVEAGIRIEQLPLFGIISSQDVWKSIWTDTAPVIDFNKQTAVFIMDRFANIPTMTAFFCAHKTPPFFGRLEDPSLS